MMSENEDSTCWRDLCVLPPSVVNSTGATMANRSLRSSHHGITVLALVLIIIAVVIAAIFLFRYLSPAAPA